MLIDVIMLDACIIVKRQVKKYKHLNIKSLRSLISGVLKTRTVGGLLRPHFTDKTTPFKTNTYVFALHVN